MLNNFLISPSQCEHMLKSRPIHLKLEKATDGKEFVKVVTQDNVRELLVPAHDINVYPTIWQNAELNRIKTAGIIVTKEQRQLRLENSEAEKRRLERECEQRKQALKDIDRARVQKTEKNELNDSGDGEDTAGRILDRAFVAKQEQVFIILY